MDKATFTSILIRIRLPALVYRAALTTRPDDELNEEKLRFVAEKMTYLIPTWNEAITKSLGEM